MRSITRERGLQISLLAIIGFVRAPNFPQLISQFPAPDSFHENNQRQSTSVVERRYWFCACGKPATQAWMNGYFCPIITNMNIFREKIRLSWKAMVMVTLVTLFAAPPALAVFYGTWMKSGEKKPLFKLEKDSDNAIVGHSSVRLSSSRASEKDKVLASIRKHADPFRKSRVKISGQMMVEGGNGQPYFFVYLYNQGFRSSEVTTSWSAVFLDATKEGWQPFELVFDVPATSWSFDYGFHQTGPGSTWVDGLGLNKVSADTPLTGGVIVQSTAQNLALEPHPDRPELLPPQWSFSPNPEGCARVVGRDDDGLIRLSWDCPEGINSTLLQVVSAQGLHGSSQSVTIDGTLLNGQASPALEVANSNSWSQADGSETAPLNQCLSVKVLRKSRRVYFGVQMSGKGELVLRRVNFAPGDCR